MNKMSHGIEKTILGAGIEEAIAQAERMLCPKGLPHTGENNRAEHGHTECWVIGELLNEIDRLRAALRDTDNDFHTLKTLFDKMRIDRDRWHKIADGLYGWAIEVQGDHVKTAEVLAYKQAVHDE